MDNENNFDRLNEAASDSAKRQDKVFDRIQNIVKEDPDSAKQYLQHLTQTSKWELYSRIYGKFAYITLLIVFLIGGLIVGINKLSVDSDETIIESFVRIKPELKIAENEEGKYFISYVHPEDKEEKCIGFLHNFTPGSNLTLNKNASEWEVFKDQIKLGNLNLIASKRSVKFDGKPYKIGTEQSFDEDDNFVFKIKSSYNYKVPNSADTTMRTMYKVYFGEKINEKVLWIKKPIEIKRTGNGSGKVDGSSSNLHKISDERWKRTYFIEMTIGNSWENDIYKLYGSGFSIGLK
ncbi:MAG: hypothetical protein GQ564_13945 [Bacteroidales bacterium]|nr:hypothetical protein [Bacteroidales bacterium]